MVLGPSHQNRVFAQNDHMRGESKRSAILPTQDNTTPPRSPQDAKPQRMGDEGTLGNLLAIARLFAVKGNNAHTRMKGAKVICFSPSIFFFLFFNLLKKIIAITFVTYC
jgi:hypothetical protein